MREYVVCIEGIGEVVKRDDCIADARTWAREGFPGRHATVRPLYQLRVCDCCGSRPCVVGRRRKEATS